MPLLTIKASNVSVPAGNYKATFQAIEEFNNEHGDAWRWVFRADDGKTISGISDAKITTGNRTGRWLCALSKKPNADGTQVATDDYIGKSYFVIVADTGNGKTRLETFSPLW